MSNIEILRGHDGLLHLLVGGHVASGAKVTGTITNADGDLCFIAVIPTKFATLGEVQNVVPFVKPGSR